MKLKTDAVIKGIAFAGCSFTWGQGLWYYSNLPTLIEQPLNYYNPNSVHFTHRKFAHKKRFARIVADYFDTFELVHYYNGGSLNAIIDYWKKIAFDEDANKLVGSEHHPAFRAFDVKDIEFFVLQCTSWTRTDINIDNRVGSVQLWDLLENHKDVLKEYLAKTNTTLDDFLANCREQDVNTYKDLLMFLENRGIKTVIMTWPAELVNNIQHDPWLTSRMITFDYNGKIYSSIEQLIENNAGMTIETDFEHFDHPPTDNHPSIECHRIIAASIINKIKEIKNDRTTTNTI